MPETLVIANPLPATTTWRVKSIFLSPGLNSVSGAFVDQPGESVLEIVLLGNGGARKERRLVGAEAHPRIVALNKANLTTKSLQKRALELMVELGEIEGTLAGTPD